MRRAHTTLVGLVLLVAATAAPRAAGADSSKLGKDQIAIDRRGPARGKDKACCGYPLVEEHAWGLRFYWIAMQDDYADDHDETPIYNRAGEFLGVFPARFLRSLLMEGTGLLSDGRVINYQGRCRFGVGTCYDTVDDDHPFGRGAGRRALEPFRSIAVDPRFIPIGEPLYVPEFDGLVLPDGSIHDGCVRADDTGGNIKKREMDFFVVSYGNFRYLLRQLDGGIWVTPEIENPRCRYLSDPR
jgi:3D (Asp-Asp-Asp) domain-containing protein